LITVIPVRIIQRRILPVRRAWWDLAQFWFCQLFSRVYRCACKANQELGGQSRQ